MKHSHLLNRPMPWCYDLKIKPNPKNLFPLRRIPCTLGAPKMFAHHIFPCNADHFVLFTPSTLCLDMWRMNPIVALPSRNASTQTQETAQRIQRQRHLSPRWTVVLVLVLTLILILIIIIIVVVFIFIFSITKNAGLGRPHQLTKKTHNALPLGARKRCRLTQHLATRWADALLAHPNSYATERAAWTSPAWDNKNNLQFTNGLSSELWRNRNSWYDFGFVRAGRFG